MILCLKCKKVWPQGTRYCGVCRASLGVRLCPEGHESPLAARCCSTCGSPKLTPGVPCLNIRPLARLVLLLVALAFLPPVLRSALAFAGCAYCAFMRTVVPPLVTLAMLSGFLAAVLGEKARRAIWEIWMSAFRLLVRFLDLLLKATLRLVLKKK